MEPSTLIPVPDLIPVAWGWLQFFLILTFVLHILFMNAMLGSSIIALFTDLNNGSENLAVVRDVSLKLPYTIAFTVNMGVAPFLFLQVLYGHFVYVSSLLMAVYWLSVVGLLIVAYYSAYVYNFKFDIIGSSRTIFITLTVLLLLVVAFMCSNNMSLMLTPDKWTQYFSNPGGTILNLSEPTLFPRYFHFVTASIAVGGLFVALVWKFKERRGHANAKDKIATGMKWFTYATLVQIILGFWFLISLPEEIMLLFLGGNSLATLLFLVGLSGAILILVFGSKNMVWPGVGALLFTVVTMVLIRDIVRTAYLKPFFSVSSLKLVPQYSPMILFLVVFVIGLILVAYMLKLAARANKEV